MLSDFGWKVLEKYSASKVREIRRIALLIQVVIIQPREPNLIQGSQMERYFYIKNKIHEILPNFFLEFGSQSEP